MRTAVLCALVAIAVPSNARAQSIPISEAEALARLSPDIPRLRAIRAAIDVARADALAAARWPNPRLTFDRESAAGVTENMTMIAQPLPITGRRGLEIEAASTLVEASANRSEDATRRARADLRLAFAQLVAAQAREQELTTSRDRLQELAAVLAKREAAGDAAGFDRLRAEREVLDAEADRSLATSERARAQATVASFFKEAVVSARLVAIARPSAPATIPSIDALVERAETARGDLLALRKEVDAARLSGRAADRRWVPEPEVVAGTKSSTAGGGDLGSVFTVHASIPLFDRGKPEQALALARASQAEARIEAFRLTLRADITALRTTVLERRDAADRYRAAAVHSAGEIERIAQVSYDAGERSILELLDAFRTGSSARIRQAALDLAVRQSEIELEFATGWEIQ
ncbi:MAG TPA: TolC family protein [Vicinamibacterales bacterium]|nr:TolC family protein [Vicinamibacterales bacterium]